MYIGGGTPSLLENKSFSDIVILFLWFKVANILKYSNINNETEFTIECDPGTFNKDKI